MTEKLEKDSSYSLWLGMLEKSISDLLHPPLEAKGIKGGLYFSF